MGPIVAVAMFPRVGPSMRVSDASGKFTLVICAPFGSPLNGAVETCESICFDRQFGGTGSVPSAGSVFAGRVTNAGRQVNALVPSLQIRREIVQQMAVVFAS